MIKAQCQRSKRCAQCLCTSVAADINGSIVAQYINEWGGIIFGICGLELIQKEMLKSPKMAGFCLRRHISISL